MKNPKVSVILPAFNAGPMLRESVGSILSQTFQDFELLVIDDGSTDGSADWLSNHPDGRVRLIRNPSNIGLVATLNWALDESRGEYVARMDADDQALPSRLEKQAAFLDSRPDIGIAGSWVRCFGLRKGDWKEAAFPSDPDTVRTALLFSNPVAHPSVMMRKSVLNDAGLRYDSRYLHAEDYGLWVEASKHTRIANIPEVLLRYRITASSVTAVAEGREAERLQVMSRIFRNAYSVFGNDWKDRDYLFYARLQRPNGLADSDELAAAEKWLTDLRSANRECGIYPEKSLELCIGRKWHDICRLNPGMETWKIYRRSELAKTVKVNFSAMLKLLVKCLLSSIRNRKKTSHSKSGDPE